MGAHAHGLTDDQGARLEVVEEGAHLRCEVRGPGGQLLAEAWRWPPPAGGDAGDCSANVTAGDGPPPHDEVLALPGLSGVAVRGRSGLTVTWPAPPPSTGVPGGGALLAGMSGPSASSPPDPVAEAWVRYRAEGEAGDRRPRLAEGLERLLAASERRGWEIVEDERMEGPVEARVVRMRRGGARRSVTLSTSLGVSSLVLIEKG